MSFYCNIQTLCFHLGMTESYIWDYGLPASRLATNEECEQIKREIHDQITQEIRDGIYSHKVSKCLGCNVKQSLSLSLSLSFSLSPSSGNQETLSFQII